MNLIPIGKVPTRSTLYRIITDGLERHSLIFDLPSFSIPQVIRDADLEKLCELAFFSMSDIGNEESHKEMFIEKCGKVGLPCVTQNQKPCI